MTTITDDQMQALLATTRQYAAVILYAGPNRQAPEAEGVVWEHGRRNIALRADGVLAIVCPIINGRDVEGLYVFNLDPEGADRVMADDPAVQAKVFTYQVYPCIGFPGDALPA